MEIDTNVIPIKNGHRWENIISGYQHLKQGGNITSDSENLNENVFFTVFCHNYRDKSFPPNMAVNFIDILGGNDN